MPQLLETNLLKPYFDQFDWYADNSRKIEITEDDIERGDFAYYRYTWEKDGKEIAVEFEKYGNGLRMVDTPHFTISASIKDPKPVFGNDYKIEFKIINKTEKPLKLAIKGYNNKNIRFDLDYSNAVEIEESIVVRFDVDPIEHDIDKYRTYPEVCANVSVNGLDADFRFGIEPRFPLSVKLIPLHKPAIANAHQTLHLNLENNFDTEATFDFAIPSTSELLMPTAQHSITLGPKERRSVPIDAIIKASTVYSPELVIVANRKDSPTIRFKRRIDAIFNTRQGIAFGKTSEDYVILNSACELTYSYRQYPNFASLSIPSRKRTTTYLDPPKLGKPYDKEFETVPPKDVEFEIEGQNILMKIYWASKKRPGLAVEIVFELSPTGILKHFFKLSTSESIFDNIYILQSLYTWRGDNILPIDDKILEIDQKTPESLIAFESDNVDENWVITKKGDNSVFLAWHDDHDANITGELGIASHFEKIEPGRKYVTKPILCAIDSFDDTHQFREFANSKRLERKRIVSSVDFAVNNYNPFINGAFDATIVLHSSVEIKGEATLAVGDKSFKGQIAEGKKSLTFDQLPLPDQPQLTKLDGYLWNRHQNRCKIVFPSTGEMKHEVIDDNGLKAHRIDNGMIDLRISPEYGPVLYHLGYRGRNMFDTSYPEHKPRSWWSPFLGGCYDDTFLGERAKTEMRFEPRVAHVKDNLGNIWEGFAVDLALPKKHSLAGVEYTDYFLTLPGVPLLLHTIGIRSTGGRFLDRYRSNNAFFKISDDCHNSRITSGIGAEAITESNYEEDATWLAADGIIKIWSTEHNLKIYAITADKKNRTARYAVKDFTLVAPEMSRIGVESGKQTILQPIFYVLTELEIDDNSALEAMDDLQNIRLTDEVDSM